MGGFPSHPRDPTAPTIAAFVAVVQQSLTGPVAAAAAAEFAAVFSSLLSSLLPSDGRRL